MRTPVRAGTLQHIAVSLCRLLIDGGQYESLLAAGLRIRRSGEPAGDLEVLTTNRLVMEDTIVLLGLRLTNTGSAEKSFSYRRGR